MPDTLKSTITEHDVKQLKPGIVRGWRGKFVSVSGVFGFGFQIVENGNGRQSLNK